MLIISTHTPLAGRDVNIGAYAVNVWISTHTPLAGRDYYKFHQFHDQYISTHTPLAGRDVNDLVKELSLSDFYSHAPRGARHWKIQRLPHNDHFYSHAPRGARPLHLAHAASAPVTYWGGPGFSLVYRAHGGPFRAKNRIFSGEPPGISQL